jgi:hypothetical protein
VQATDAIKTCVPDASARVTVFPKEDIRGVDNPDLKAEGLPANTTFAVFLTELPVAPLGRNNCERTNADPVVVVQFCNSRRPSFLELIKLGIRPKRRIAELQDRPYPIEGFRTV